MPGGILLCMKKIVYLFEIISEKKKRQTDLRMHLISAASFSGSGV